MTDETKTARLRLRGIEKKTRRSFIAHWPWTDGISLCYLTGRIEFDWRRTGNVVEYNDRGQRVLRD